MSPACRKCHGGPCFAFWHVSAIRGGEPLLLRLRQLLVFHDSNRLTQSSDRLSRRAVGQMLPHHFCTSELAHLIGSGKVHRLLYYAAFVLNLLSRLSDSDRRLAAQQTSGVTIYNDIAVFIKGILPGACRVSTRSRWRAGCPPRPPQRATRLLEGRGGWGFRVWTALQALLWAPWSLRWSRSLLPGSVPSAPVSVTQMQPKGSSIILLFPLQC